MSTRRESAVLGIKTQHKSAKLKGKVQVLNERLKAAIGESDLHNKELTRLDREIQRSRKKVLDSEKKVREIRVKIAAAGG